MATDLVNLQIQDKIFTLRNQQVILDRDLALLYEVENRALKQAVSRNVDKFPSDLMFILTSDEVSLLVSQFVIPSKQKLGGAKPYAFTEQGVSMLSSVLSSKTDVKISIDIFRAFVNMRKFIVNKKLQLDLQKYNKQYQKITIKEFTKSHDRFLIIDNQDIYHFGASIKDLGKKWFAFSKMDKNNLNLLEKLPK